MGNVAQEGGGQAVTRRIMRAGREKIVNNEIWTVNEVILDRCGIVNKICGGGADAR